RLHWITRERQAKTLPAVNGIEEHDYFSPVSRRARKPTGVERFGSWLVISEKGDLPGIVNRRSLHIEIRSTNRRGIRHLHIPFIDLIGANDDAARGDTTADDGTERNLIGIIDIWHGASWNRSSVLKAEALNAKARKRSTFRRRIADSGYLCDHAIVPHEQVAIDCFTNLGSKKHDLPVVIHGAR